MTKGKNMFNKYKNLTPEECAKTIKKDMIKVFVIYILALIIIVSMFLKVQFSLIDLLYDDYTSVFDMYDYIDGIIDVDMAIWFIACITVMIIAVLVKQNAYIGIFYNLCDPEKYIQSELVRYKKCPKLLNVKSRRISLGYAYLSLNDYENAWNYLKYLVPSNISKCKNVRILNALADYYYETGDKDTFSLYKDQMDALAKSGNKNIVLLVALNNYDARIALDAKRYDEAKELYKKYLGNKRLSKITKTNYYYILGKIAYDTGDYIDAVYYLKNALESGSKLPFAADAKEMLESITKKFF